MLNSLWLALALCCVAFFADKATAIYCYSCESEYEPGCVEDFEAAPYFKLDCSRLDPPRYLEKELATRNASACMKREFVELGVKKIVRRCFFGDVNDTETGCRADPSLADIQDEQCYVCDNENYCNHSDRPMTPLVTATLLMGLLSIAQAFLKPCQS